MKNQNTKVFIVGAPRSGTSILVFALKEVFALPGYGESHVIPAFQRIVHHLRAYTNGFSNIPDPIMLKKLNRPELEKFIFDCIRDFYAKNFPEGKWIDKTPTGEAVFGLPLIEVVFPDARLIATKRNGIEVVESHLKKFDVSFDDACHSWLNAMKGLVHAREGCKNLVEVDQYDLLNNTIEISRKIAVHLRSEERANDLAHYFMNNEVERSSTHDPTKRLRLADTSWSLTDQGKFRNLCGEMMVKFGYEL